MNKLLDKLKKLIAHEESARAIGNIAEAEAFADKIQQLLDTKNLSMSDVEVHAEQSSEIDCDVVSSEAGKFEEWQKVLSQGICEINGCTSLISPLGFLFIGRKTDREIAVSLYRYFEKLGFELGEKYQNSGVAYQHSLAWDGSGFRLIGLEKTEKEINSYLLGFAVQVSSRLKINHRKNKEQSENLTALVFLSSKYKDSQEFAEKVFKPEEASLPKEDDLDQNAFFQGLRKGDQIALTDKVIEQ